MGALNSIKVNSLDPATDNTSNIISDFGRDKFVRIGWNEDTEEVVDNSEGVRKQFEGLVIWNMLAASRCSQIEIMNAMPEDSTITEGSMPNLRTGNREGGTAYFNDADPSDLGLGFNNGDFEDNAVGFEPLKKTGFNGRCAQADSAVREFNSEMPGDYSLSHDDTKEPGGDMEGNYGKVNFNISGSSFSIDPKSGTNNDDILLGFHSEFGSENLFDDLPDFYTARRGAILVPPNVNGGQDSFDERLGEERHQIRIFSKEGVTGDFEFSIFNDMDTHRETFYAWRPRVNGGTFVLPSHKTPHIISRLMNNDYNVLDQQDYAGWGNKDQRRDRGDNVFDQMLVEGKWFFCEGGEGYVISAARNIGEYGEASDENLKEDVVFPEIVVEERGEGEKCSPGGPEGDWNKVSANDLERTDVSGESYNHEVEQVSRTDTYNSEVAGEITCSREAAAEKRVVEEVTVEGSNGNEKEIKFACGLKSREWDFGDDSSFNHGSPYKGSVDYYLPAVYVQCDPGSYQEDIPACN